MQLQQHIFFIGFMGSGKSYHARRIAQMRGDEELFLDLDLLIAEEAGMSIPDIFAQLGERAFRALEQEALIKVIEQPPHHCLRRGLPLLVRQYAAHQSCRPVYFSSPSCFCSSPTSIARKSTTAFAGSSTRGRF